jgi:hypothetical protein
MAMVQPWCSSTHGTAEGPHLPTAADANGMLAIQRAHTCGNGKTSVLQDNHINHCPKLNHNMCTYHECSSHASTTGFFGFPWVCFQPESWIDVPITLILGAHMCHHVPRIPHRGPLTGPGLARTRSKCSTHRPSWAAGRASGAETSHVERHFAQLHFAQNKLFDFWHSKLNTLSSHTSGYVPNWAAKTAILVGRMIGILGHHTKRIHLSTVASCCCFWPLSPGKNKHVTLCHIWPGCSGQLEDLSLRAIPAFLS